jgi:hypothetical protein
MVSFKLFFIGFMVTTPGARLDGSPLAGADEHQVSSALGWLGWRPSGHGAGVCFVRAHSGDVRSGRAQLCLSPRQAFFCPWMLRCAQNEPSRAHRILIVVLVQQQMQT